MSKPGSFASLRPRLLARKGSARPAMRSGQELELEVLSASYSALTLGRNDNGKHSSKQSSGAACRSGRRTAFTLRLDADRHFKLRLASTLQDRSAQVLVTEALDRFLSDIPQLDQLAAQAGQASTKA